MSLKVKLALKTAKCMVYAYKMRNFATNKPILELWKKYI
uniref:Uncharacterized protein n=1 Tax=Myoviridae sp. ctBoB21 TaxID=2827287 RepID=A0A8S5R6R7_9CAUD|nr:MAG TPA: hypothetical protein [Myoviridae sp. ctBoB21]